MKLLDKIKNIFRKEEIEQSEIELYEVGWKELLHVKPRDEDVEKSMEEQPLAKEQLREKQIKGEISTVLFKDGYLKKDDIIEEIEKNNETVVLNDAEIQAIISICGVMQYEDTFGTDNIRDFIDDDENNMVRLVDKLVENARKEAEKHEMEDICQFVSNDVKVIDSLKNEIMQEMENDEREE